MLRNTTATWGWGAKALHWIGALAILILLGHGWWMTHMTPRPERLANYAWHAALGYDFLVLLVIRLLWRWTNAVPDLPADTKPWERFAAHAGHVGLYVLMFVVAGTGWAVAVTARTPMTTDLFGLSFAPVITLERSTRNLIEGTHEVLAYLTAVLVLVHIAGALRHHFVKKNDVLRRMAA
ncbi:MAG: cytochrome b [Xanthobacteraceae bacterium]